MATKRRTKRAPAPPKDITENQLKWQVNEIVANISSSRAKLMERLFDRRRNVDDECGYLEPSEIRLADYQHMYEREGIAHRVVHCLPEETWKICPEIYETDDEEETEFERAWKDLAKTLCGRKSYVNVDKSRHPIFDYMERVDVLSGIGFYGVLLMGTNDGKALSEPLERSESLELTYVRAFPQNLAEISTWDNDESSERYGKPVLYNLTFHDVDAATEINYEPTRSQQVHWTRIIHVADNRGSSDIFGCPRMRPVWNRLYDLRKVYGGCAEMYWQGAFPGLAFETHPQLGAEVMLPENLDDVVEEYYNSLKRYLGVEGVHINSLAPQVVDPSPQIDKLIEAICIYLGIPKRVFMGSERGELASSQDSEAWDERLEARRKKYAAPGIIYPIIDWLIEYGILPEPANGFHTDWDEEEEQPPLEKAQVMVFKTDAIVKYVGGSGDQLIEPYMFLTEILGFSDEEAKAIMDATEKYIGVLEEEEAAQADEQMQKMAELGLTPQAGAIGDTSFGPPQPPATPQPQPPQ